MASHTYLYDVEPFFELSKVVGLKIQLIVVKLQKVI